MTGLFLAVVASDTNVLHQRGKGGPLYFVVRLLIRDAHLWRQSQPLTHRQKEKDGEENRKLGLRD